eukprot:SAG31_NODE_602_length_13638_cov_32.936037_15_plen_47_part_00
MQADMGGVEGVESLLEETEEAHATLREIEVTGCPLLMNQIRLINAR